MSRNTATYQFLAAVSVLLVLAACDQHSERQLTFVSFGGAYQAAQDTAYISTFSQEYDIDIVQGTYNGDYGLLRTRATAPNGRWDIVSVEAAPTARGIEEGIFAEIPQTTYSGLTLIPGTAGKYAAGHLAFSTILAIDTTAFPNQRPTGWEDFWDLEEFPGRRGLRNNPRGTLEIALLASGVPRDSLYPLDVERALNKLDELGINVIFWESGAQPVQLLANRTVSMTSAYNGRVADARDSEGLPFDIVWQNGLFEVESWVVPANSQHKELAFDFIRHSLRPEQQAEFVALIAYGPTNTDALELVPPETKANLPTNPAILPSQIAVNTQWWAENEQNVQLRWEQWKAQR